MASLIDNPFIVRNITFGIEDSLISTTGVLVGVAAAGFQAPHIVTTGVILILVEASSMAYGAFLSEENFLKTSGTTYNKSELLGYALTMFLSYVLVGALLLLPFALKASHPVPIVLGMAWIMLMGLVYAFEKNMYKVGAVSLVGCLLMVASTTIGRYLKV